ncbi:valine--tRNA ligase, partial [Desulfobacterales bacterium HSG16]|nr:valine--tRNA ligase [Desulfobacterales bacterium HSG16]
YPLSDGSGSVTVATTRPETMLGDTAVAINPEDERYKDIKADTVILPLQNNEIPIIRDEYVDTSFGTGCLKITPAHDPNDYQIGQKHKLPSVKVIGDDGIMTDLAGNFEGLDRFECRDAVVKALKDKGLLEKIVPHPHSVGHCYRCNTVIEPNLSRQWFVSVKPLAEKAIAAVKEGKTRIIPQMWTKTYFEWMNNIRDWCISRQIWWGHQIPAWTCEKCEKIIVEMEDPAICPDCGSDKLIRETDVLDTWFSSALWPFSTMGWPDETDLLKKYYPTSALVTGFDILFFWVARMMMMGIHFMGDVPFKDVYVHALVRDEKGKKMSKSTGNVIDPLVVIEKYGTDAFRFTLTAFAAQGRDVKMSEKRVEGYRHFINKLWNAARFALMHIDKGYDSTPDKTNLSLQDEWILSRLGQVVENTSDALEDFRFNDAASTLYQFVWHEFCDWYLEAIKPALYGKEGEERKEACKKVLWQVLHDLLIMLHPIIPFVTEEIWDKLPGTQGSIMYTTYPSDVPDTTYMSRNEKAESGMKMIMSIVTGIRNIRGEMNISPSLTIDVVLYSSEEDTRKSLTGFGAVITDLARLKSLDVTDSENRPKAAATGVVEGATIFVPLEGIIDFAQETKRLSKEIDKVNKELAKVSKKLNNEDFLAKAPEEVKAKVREKYEALSEKQHNIESHIKKIQDIEAD